MIRCGSITLKETVLLKENGTRKIFFSYFSFRGKKEKEKKKEGEEEEEDSPEEGVVLRSNSSSTGCFYYNWPHVLYFVQLK